MDSINEWQKKSAGELIKLYFTSGWIFEKWYEKVIMIALGILGMWKIAGWIF